MSVREAKGRLLSREYMADRDFMTNYTASEREWYVLTSLFSDDAGYIRHDPEQLAADMYRYVDMVTREADTRRCIEKFSASGRYLILGCGVHAKMARVAKRPRSGQHEHKVYDEHLTDCAPQTTQDRLETSRVGSPSIPFQSSPIQSLPVARNGTFRSTKETLFGLAGWENFGAAEWAPFIEAWTAKGFRLPPLGSPDDPKSQRAVLWEIAQSRPNDLAKWVMDAPGTTARDVVGYVLSRWHIVKAQVTQ